MQNLSGNICDGGWDSSELCSQKCHVQLLPKAHRCLACPSHWDTDGQTARLHCFLDCGKLDKLDSDSGSGQC